MKFSITLAQASIYYHQCIYEKIPFYNVGGYIFLHNPRVDRLKEAHAKLIERFESFGLRISTNIDGIMYEVSNNRTEELQLIDFRDQEVPESAASDWLAKLFSQPISIENNELFKAYVLRVSETHYYYVGMSHHIAMDGLGFVNWARSLANIYNDESDNWLEQQNEILLCSLVEKDQRYLNSKRYLIDERYWSREVGKFEDCIFTPAYNAGEEGRFASSAKKILSLPVELREKISYICDFLNVSNYQLVLALLSIYFTQAYSSSSILVGTPLHNRSNPQQKVKIGLLMTMLPLHIEVSPESSLKRLIESIASSQREILRHRNYPSSKIAGHKGNKRNKTQPYDICFSYMPVGDYPQFDNHPSKLVYCSHNHEQNPLLVTFWDGKGQKDTEIQFDYNLDYFSGEEIKRIISRLIFILNQLADAPEISIGSLQLVTEEERKKLVDAARAQKLPLPVEPSLYEAFEKKVWEIPSSIALKGEFGELSYAGLQQRIDRLAGFLFSEKGIRPFKKVAVLLPRSQELIVALLALIKLEAIYVPVDMGTPKDRIEYIVEDSQAELLIISANSQQLAVNGFASKKYLYIEDAFRVGSEFDYEEKLLAEKLEARRISENTPMYILYTSGSTGVPKGVLVSAGSAANLLKGTIQRLALTGGGRWLFISSVAFDISIVEWLGCLLLGNTCVIASEKQVTDLFALSELIETENICLIQATPSRLKQFLNAGWKPERTQTIISAGEPLTGDLVKEILKYGAQLWNGYGPTEATVYSLIKKVTLEEPLDAQTSIGHPLPNYYHYVVNKNLALVAPGIPGELIIAGAGLALEYINLPQLTSQRFTRSKGVPEPLFYRTGDIVSLRQDGNYNYLGRNDEQVKLRGYRIDLNEIKSVLLKHPEIIDSAVVVNKGREGKADQLIAYICPKNIQGGTLSQTEKQLLIDEFKRYLSAKLPGYMVPSAFLFMGSLPVNSSGKLDKHRLPKIERDESAELAALRTDNETLVATIWSQVLRVSLDSLGADSNFFELGGDSITAVRVIAILRDTCSGKISIADLFDYPTIEEFSKRIRQLPAVERLDRVERIARNSEYFKTSSSQHRLWFLNQRSDNVSNYNLAASYKVTGELDTKVVENILKCLIERHEILRTVYTFQDGELRQRLLSGNQFGIEVVDWSNLSEREKEKSIDEFIDSNVLHHFDLEKEPPISLRIAKINSDESIIAFNIHHIAADAWSVRTLIEEFMAAYFRMRAGGRVEQPPLEHQYIDYAAWQYSQLSKGCWDHQLSYWQQQLSEIPSLHSLPLDFVRPKVKSDEGDCIELEIGSSLVLKAREVVKRCSSSNFCLLQSVFALLLCKWSYSNEVMIGSPVFGRTAKELEPILGMFVNMLAFRHNLRAGECFIDYLCRFNKTAQMALDNQDIPFEQVVEKVKGQVDNSFHPLFQILFTFQDDIKEAFEIPGLKLESLKNRHTSAKFDLELIVSEKNGRWACQWIYSTSLFSHTTIKSLAERFAKLLGTLVSNPEVQIDSLGLAPEIRFNNSFLNRNSVQTRQKAEVAHRLFEAAVEQYPNALSVVSGKRKLTYKQLNSESNKLARVILGKGLGPGSHIGICLGREPELIISVLAVLKAGCAYVPVDPDYPQLRQSFIISDARLQAIVTSKKVVDENKAVSEFQNLLVIDSDQLQSELSAQSDSNIDSSVVPITGDNLAYIIYTSGSTGKPKGVMIAHRGLANLAVSQARAFEISEYSRVLQFASFSFDAAVSEWSITLSNGATLVMIPESIRSDLPALAEWAGEHLVTHVTLSPAVLKKLNPKDFSTLTHLISAGEELSYTEAERWASHCKLINAYGPTEATVCASVGGINTEYKKVTIGTALDGLQLYVMDRTMQIAAPGALGELWISGLGVAKGYINRPDLAQSAFLSMPGENDETVRCYRTGDLVRQLPNGELVFEGRIDEQIKVRGHRVECGEIEACILEHPLAKAVAVCPTTSSDGNIILTAFVAVEDIPDEPHANTVIEIRRVLTEKLPAYMLPGFIHLLEELPVTSNGKVDKQKLKSIKVIRQNKLPERKISRTESALVSIWSAVLNIDVHDIHASFFQLGGHSLLISEVIEKINNEFNIHLSIKQFFEHDSIADLSRLIESNAIESESRRWPELQTQKDNSDSGPLSFAQQRLWFLDQMESNSRHYNMPVALKLRGKFSVQDIEQTLQKIIDRHEILRTVFKVDSRDMPVQIVRETVVFQLSIIESEVSGRLDDELLAAELTAPFDLENDLLIRASLFYLAKDEAILTLTLHHIAADGWSIDILVSEFERIFQSLQGQSVEPLPPLPVQYRDYAKWQRDVLQGKLLVEGMNFWRKYLDGIPQVHSLPLDKKRPDQQKFEGRTWTGPLSPSLTARLRKLSQSLDASVFLTMQTAFAVLLSRWSGSTDITVATPFANRNHKSLNSLIGFFVNTLVIRTRCIGNMPFAELLKENKKGFAGVYEHQYVPFESLVEELNHDRTLAYNPLVQVLFVLQEGLNQKLGKINIRDLDISIVEHPDSYPVKFDLELNVFESEEGSTCHWNYDASLFAEQTIIRLFESYVMILEAICEEPQSDILSIGIVSPEERKRLLNPPVELPEQAPKVRSICRLFEIVARDFGQAIAVVDSERKLTYTELDTCSTQLANWLHSRGVIPGAPVAIYMKRSPEMIIAILAVIKSGSPYLPLDISYPESRISFILQDSNASLLLTDTDSFKQVNALATLLSFRCMDDAEFESEYRSCSSELNQTDINDPESLVYYVYTSGSTGQPKGVMVRHESFINLILWYVIDYRFTPADKCLLLGSIGFDMTQKNIFAPLLTGSTLVIPDEYFDPDSIAGIVDKHKVTVINCAPSASYALFEQPLLWPCFTSLRLLALGGEAIKIEPLTAWLNSEYCEATLLNMYGPSECTDIAIARSYQRSEVAHYGSTLPIGSPIYNCFAYVLNEQLQLQPQGVVGELYIGGLGVSNGYVNNNDLNQRNFVKNPYSAKGTLYRTGDLARLRADGTFDYMGRIDNQIKIRGFRVETAEIESVLASHEKIRQAVVIVRESSTAAGRDADAELIGFLVLAEHFESTPNNQRVLEEVRRNAIARLPNFMVPGKLVVVASLPLTPNGKVDRNELKIENYADSVWQVESCYRTPRTETEIRLCEIWCRLLKLEKIGVDDNFFDIGGHSLLATRLSAIIKHQFAIEGVSIAVKDLFQNPTVATLAEIIDSKVQYSKIKAKEKLMLESNFDVEEGVF